MKSRVLSGIVALLLLAMTAACGDGGAAQSTQKLRVFNLVFCSEEAAGYMDYREQPGAAYKPGDRVWLYVNVQGQKHNANEDGTNEVWITENVKVVSPDGSTLLDEEALSEHQNFPRDLSMEKLYLSNYITTTPQLPAGKYTVELTVADKLGGDTAKASSSFVLNPR